LRLSATLRFLAFAIHFSVPACVDGDSVLFPVKLLFLNFKYKEEFFIEYRVFFYFPGKKWNKNVIGYIFFRSTFLLRILPCLVYDTVLPFEDTGVDHPAPFHAAAYDVIIA
jgi:hypothetical protein